MTKYLRWFQAYDSHFFICRSFHVTYSFMMCHPFPSTMFLFSSSSTTTFFDIAISYIWKHIREYGKFIYISLCFEINTLCCWYNFFPAHSLLFSILMEFLHSLTSDEKAIFFRCEDEHLKTSFLWFIVTGWQTSFWLFLVGRKWDLYMGSYGLIVATFKNS